MWAVQQITTLNATGIGNTATSWMSFCRDEFVVHALQHLDTRAQITVALQARKSADTTRGIKDQQIVGVYRELI